MAAHLSNDLVRLQAWTVQDAGWYARESKDEQVQRFTSDPATLTVDDVEQAIRQLNSESTSAFLIKDAQSDTRLGNVAVDLDAAGVGHVSYWVAAQGRGRGVATSAIRLVSEWLTETGRTTELRLWTHEDNVASQRVAEKAGFVRDPDRDGSRTVKGDTWHTLAYRRAL